MDTKDSKKEQLEKIHHVPPPATGTPPADNRELGRIQNVNVVGGENQTHPVKFVLSGHNESDVAELDTNTANAWHHLKNRPSVFTLMGKSIKYTGPKSEADVEAVIQELSHNEEEFKGVAKHLFPSIGITAKFANHAEFMKDRNSVSTLRNFLQGQAQINTVNMRADYARVKSTARMLASSWLAGTKDSFIELEKVLDQRQLDYMHKMYQALGIKPLNTPYRMIELIWSYWMEEGMLAQSMYAISRRFQNIRNGDLDPLANFAIDPLRTAGDLLWGYIQDAPNRLTVQRRSYEYENHYGLRLFGSALPRVSSADSRSKFIGAFNNLLVKCGVFYRQADNLTVRADAFPVLNALQELHLILAEGANNQYGNLPIESRVEMLTEQYILARPEIRDFLNTRVMVPYKEEWMGRVDALKKLQRWDPTGITYYYELANFGEILLLSIRFVNWTDINSSETAGTWAKFFRNEIQKYIFNYRAVTGVDLSSESSSTAEERNTIPGILIQRRLKHG